MSMIVSQKPNPLDTHPHSLPLQALAALLDDDPEAAGEHLQLMTYHQLRSLATASRNLSHCCRDTFTARVWASLEKDE